MKFIVAILLSALLAFAGGLYFPWWIIAVTSFIIGVFIHQKTLWAFIAGFIGLFLLWGVLAFIIDLHNHHLLSAKVAAILPLRGSSSIIILVTAFIGAIVSGFAAMTGSLFRKLFARSDRQHSEVIYS